MPFADVGPYKVPEGLRDDQVLFLTDIFPTGYQAAENCDIQPGDTIAVWGCGPVGLFAIQSAYMLGAERVIAIDRFPERLQMAQQFGGAEVINYEQVDVGSTLKEMTGGRGPDSCIDVVGMEAHGMTLDNLYDKGMQMARIGIDKPLFSGRRSCPAVKAERSPCPASTAVCSTCSQSEPPTPRA